MGATHETHTDVSALANGIHSLTCTKRMGMLSKNEAIQVPKMILLAWRMVQVYLALIGCTIA
jgi:hypothetical protein